MDGIFSKNISIFYVAEILNESQENLCIKTVEDESNLLFSHRKRENNSQEVLEDCSDVTDQVNNLLCQSKFKKYVTILTFQEAILTGCL